MGENLRDTTVVGVLKLVSKMTIRQGIFLNFSQCRA